ncbi:hypothetical protein XENOCAPTIV_024098 [Xenoophorus captivus]|uniref:Uncharacterized protein n=1 Tax=Xenoophorus captivus TaxID=1517983 RepID=A0ABV0RKF5_9TELE
MELQQSVRPALPLSLIYSPTACCVHSDASISLQVCTSMLLSKTKSSLKCELTHAQGKHKSSMQKDRRLRFKPRTFLLQGYGANCTILQAINTIQFSLFI